MEQYLSELIASTQAYIASDPTTVRMAHRRALRAPGGGYTYSYGPPGPELVVKLIGKEQDGISSGEGGKDRQFDYVIVAEPGVDIKIGDKWKDSLGNEFFVHALNPDNGYEVKAFARSYGASPSDG